MNLAKTILRDSGDSCLNSTPLELSYSKRSSFLRFPPKYLLTPLQRQSQERLEDRSAIRAGDGASRRPDRGDRKPIRSPFIKPSAFCQLWKIWEQERPRRIQGMKEGERGRRLLFSPATSEGIMRPRAKCFYSISLREPMNKLEGEMGGLKGRLELSRSAAAEEGFGEEASWRRRRKWNWELQEDEKKRKKEGWEGLVLFCVSLDA